MKTRLLMTMACRSPPKIKVINNELHSVIFMTELFTNYGYLVESDSDSLNSTLSDSSDSSSGTSLERSFRRVRANKSPTISAKNQSVYKTQSDAKFKVLKVLLERTMANKPSRSVGLLSHSNEVKAVISPTRKRLPSDGVIVTSASNAVRKTQFQELFVGKLPKPSTSQVEKTLVSLVKVSFYFSW